MTRSVLARAAERQKTARRILAELDILSRWEPFGRPVVVGAVAYGLVVSPDIDMEIYCPDLRIEHGFEVLKACASHPNVLGARFHNALAEKDAALYWQLRYVCQNGEEWKIDMWSAPEDYVLPRGEDLVEPMKRALTPAIIEMILELKEARSLNPEMACPSIHLYRAVFDDGVRTPEGLQDWLQARDVSALTDWRPDPPRHPV